MVNLRSLLQDILSELSSKIISFQMELHLLIIRAESSGYLRSIESLRTCIMASHCPFFKNNSLLLFGAILSHKEFNHMLQNSFQNINKISSKIDQAHCSISIRIMRSPLSQRFQLFSHNKPAKVENNLNSFQTVFKIDRN